MARTDSKIDTPVTRGDSRPVRYEVVDKDGQVYGPFRDIFQAYGYANERWPDQEQDPDRTGKGWDVQVVGCDR